MLNKVCLLRRNECVTKRESVRQGVTETNLVGGADYMALEGRSPWVTKWAQAYRWAESSDH
jgi:transketolase C-terminal domain/subunit